MLRLLNELPAIVALWCVRLTLPLQEALAASFKTRSAGEVTQITRDLLAKLQDPYTRLLQAEEDAALAAEEEGKVCADCR